MQDAHFVAMLELVSCVIGVGYGAFLIYGLQQQWRWGHRSARMDVGHLLSHRRQDDLGPQTCSALRVSDGLRFSCDESDLPRAILF